MQDLVAVPRRAAAAYRRWVLRSVLIERTTVALVAETSIARLPERSKQPDKARKVRSHAGLETTGAFRRVWTGMNARTSCPARPTNAR